jgi:hypothetical protein
MCGLTGTQASSWFLTAQTGCYTRTFNVEFAVQEVALVQGFLLGLPFPFLNFHSINGLYSFIYHPGLLQGQLETATAKKQ